MGQLAGLRYREIVQRIKRLGFEFDRQAAGSHEIWFNPVTRHSTTIPNHPGDMRERTLRAILRQAGVGTEEFLRKKWPLDPLLLMFEHHPLPGGIRILKPSRVTSMELWRSSTNCSQGPATTGFPAVGITQKKRKCRITALERAHCTRYD